MKRYLAVLLAVFLLTLSGCGWIQNEYSSVAEHKEPYVYNTEATEEKPPEAANAEALKNLILSFVRSGTAQAIIDVSGYSGTARDDMPRILEDLKTNPIYAYAVDYADYEIRKEESADVVEIDMVYRRSADEIAAIENVRGMDKARSEIETTLKDFDVALSLKISDYADMDYAAYVRSYCLNNPGLTVQIPEVTVAVYPNDGSTRVVELHFSYSATRDDLRNMLASVSTLLSSAGKYVRYGETQRARLELLCGYLLTRNTYTEAENDEMPAYALLCSQQATASGFASVFCYVAKLSGMECWLVNGTKDGAPYYWNILNVDGQYYHIDMMQQWRNAAAEPMLYTDSQMSGYVWNTEEYPVCSEPEGTAQP